MKIHVNKQELQALGMKARVCAKFTRFEGKSVTALDVVRLAERHKRERERDVYLTKRRALIDALDAQFTSEERHTLAKKLPAGKAYGWNDLHIKKARGLPMTTEIGC